MSSILNVAPYRPTEAAQWDQCVRDSECACLLFYRSYMDYHADRFTDASLTARLNDRLIGIFPASVDMGGACSHGGLTFGGWQFLPGLSVEIRQQVHATAIAFFRQAGCPKVLIRVMPKFFFSNLACIDEWERPGAAIIRTMTGAAVDLSAPEKLGAKRRPRVTKALESLEFSVATVDEFWPILVEVLATRHGVPPVHSLEEMKLLQNRFPENIIAYKATRDKAILAGAIIYLSRDIAHIQYMATSLEGRAAHALDALIVWLMRSYAGRLRWLSMGISNERDGRINQGLLDYKLSFGACPFPHHVIEYDFKE
jgi:hypothetical protein